MRALIPVAPREIRDLVYRSSRIAGCDAGTAERMAENVTFAEICHGASVSAYCEALTAGDLAGSAWPTAPDKVLAAELAWRAAGEGTAAFDPEVPLAAIAATLWQATSRGALPAGFDSRASGDDSVRAVRFREADETAVAAARKRVVDAHQNAHRRGVKVDRNCFNRLEAAAAGFLVSEKVLDSLI